MIKYIILFTLLSTINTLSADGLLVNPITDVCWNCLFPMTVSGVNVTLGHKDHISYNKVACFCGGVSPKGGIPLSFYEPANLVDVTVHPYKMLGLGGISLGSDSIKNKGSISSNINNGTRTSFYHVHFYTFPVMKILELFSDFSCVEKDEIDVSYMSELDPMWSDDHLAFITNPEAALFSSRLAQVSCMADCGTSNISSPKDELFWCAGCVGSLYPFSGHVAHHVGGIQASSLLTYRLLAKMHRSYLLKGFEKDNFCEAKYMSVIKKSLYKTQLVYPIANSKGPCPSLGTSDVFWGAGKSYPKGGEEFVYLIWRKKQCCLDVISPAIGNTIP